MEAVVLNKNFEAVAILDSFKSFIWTDRYDRCGDFEIYNQVTNDMLSNLQEDYYLWSRDSDHVMIIEDMILDTDVDNGNHVKVTGRSLESILDRRVIWKQTVLSGNLHDGIKQLINENIISPSDSNRKISNFIFEDNIDDYMSSIKLDNQYLGENLYDVIVSLCETYSIGFKVTLNSDNQFVFKLYNGIDRSYDQIANPYVIFSPKFENIINSNYIQSKKTLKTVSLVLGEGEGASRKTTTAEIESGAGTELDRREMYTDARDISSDVGEETLSDTEYTNQLKERGLEELAYNSYTMSFEGQVETSKMFVYGKDFFMGDILQIENEFGMQSKARVIELVRSHDTGGYSVYPTFSAI